MQDNLIFNQDVQYLNFTIKKMKVQTLTADTFHRFGTFRNFIDRGENSAQKEAPLHFTPDLLQIASGQLNPVSFSMLRIYNRPLVITHSEYHNYCEEGMLPLDGDVLIHVAPAVPGSEFPENEVEVFLVPKGTLVVLKVGVWHHAPYTVEQDSVNVMIILPQRTYMNDCHEITLKSAIKLS